MANLQLKHAPILNSSAQLLILPVNTAGTLLDPILTRAKTLFPDNYQRYYRACRDGSLSAGSCLLHKRTREQAGLGISSNGNQPSYIANLVISDHPYHPTRTRWLTDALIDLHHQLIPLVRYHGIRRAALLARPLIDNRLRSNISNSSNEPSSKNFSAGSLSLNEPNVANSLPLDWYLDILPLLRQQLQDLPKLRIDVHVPKSIDIVS
ncbi:hypothetical protein [Psychrobacter immobilis]|uniref:hypothetical protein n=1 Tax=Psychrobacter immobilis TaxID=498 RepID=UPI0019189DF7|nr:hypothetical protein [Psychrobacter immobilis]